MRSLKTKLLFVAAPLLAVSGVVAQDPPADPNPNQIVLNGSQKLTVSGQYRFRSEGFYNYDFTRGAGASEDFISQRARIRLDFEASDDIKVVLELQDVRLWGEETSTVDASADGFDFHQAYVEIKNMPGVGGTTKFGRQRVAYGDQRIIGGLDWLQQARAFNGVKNRWKTESGWIDAFAFQTRERFNNGTNDDQFFGGIYSQWGIGENTKADVYLLFLHDDGTTAGATQNRGTLGTLIKHKDGNLTIGGEFATQFGKQGGMDIPIGETLALNLHAKLTGGEGASKWWVGVDANYASGNDPNTADNERFNNLFPTAHKFWGFMDFATWSNLTHGSIGTGFALTEKSSLNAFVHIFRANEETDRLAGPRGVLTGGSAAGSSKSMGEELDIVYKLNLDTGGRTKSHLHIGYGIFLPGSGVRDAVGDDDLAHFVYIQSGIKF